MLKGTWQVMSKYIKHINYLFVIGIIFYYFFMSWPFIKLAAIELFNQFIPGPVVFNFLLEIIPPYKLNSSSYAIEPILGQTYKKEKNEQIFREYPTFLEIPSVSIKGLIVEGSNEKAMDYGFWHYPGTGDIKRGGNIVIIGHRFLKLPPAKDTFFNLDKVSIGDKVFLKNKLGVWTFIVVKKKIVNVNAVEFLQNNENKLTLITCHPVWTSKERLVIIAIPVKKNNENIF